MSSKIIRMNALLMSNYQIVYNMYIVKTDEHTHIFWERSRISVLVTHIIPLFKWPKCPYDFLFSYFIICINIYHATIIVNLILDIFMIFMRYRDSIQLACNTFKLHTWKHWGNVNVTLQFHCQVTYIAGVTSSKRILLIVI